MAAVTRPIACPPEVTNALVSAAAPILPIGTTVTETPEEVINHVFDNVLGISSGTVTGSTAATIVDHLKDDGTWDMHSLLSLGKGFWARGDIYGDPARPRTPTVQFSHIRAMNRLIDFNNANINFNGRVPIDWMHVTADMFNYFGTHVIPDLDFQFPAPSWWIPVGMTPATGNC
jgi:hypothetical protein